MAEEEKSAGSGFGKLVYGTLKGNGINTEGMSFEEAVKKFNELGGTDNWHAKIMKREADEKQAKETANATKNTESQNQKQIPKEFKKNEDKNHYEYGGAIIRESEYEDGLVEVSIKGHTIMASDLEDAKKTIDEFNGTESTSLKEEGAKYTKSGKKIVPYKEWEKKVGKDEAKARIQKWIDSHSESVNNKINAKATADEIINNPNSSDFEKNLYKGAKEEINKNSKKFMEDAKAGRIKPENSAPKEFKWNENTNSYEYRGLNVMKSPTMDGYYEIDYGGDEILTTDLNEAKNTIDGLMDREKSLGSAERLEADDIKKKEEAKQNARKIDAYDFKASQRETIQRYVDHYDLDKQKVYDKIDQLHKAKKYGKNLDMILEETLDDVVANIREYQ